MERVNSVTETELFKRLEEKTGRTGTPISCDNIGSLCHSAKERMKQMPAFHPQFTLHDAAHLLRVTQLMGLVLGDVLAELNALEIALLILAAHFHDQGMIPEEADRAAIEVSDDFRLHRERWTVEHPNFGEIKAQRDAGHLDEKHRHRLDDKLAELEAAIWSDFLRETHGKRSAEFVSKHYENDERLKVDGVSLIDLLSTLCESHVEDPSHLKELSPEELIGTHAVNLRYLAVVLRLADVLDFDRERTPDTLYRTIHFTSDVSLRAWEEHRSVKGWVIRPKLIRFDMKFEQPSYERSARLFMDYIDRELEAAHDLIGDFKPDFIRYQLHLPRHVDRSGIGPHRDSYVYYDLEFSLSRDEIVKLLMTDKLYGAPSLCVRELLQNSLDALSYRHAVFRYNDLEWKGGRVEFEHGIDESGNEFLRCTDNGAGMDEEFITSFLTKVGKSFYRSPLFEQQRVRFREKGVDFDPCSQFGIGFMSCFMLGDRIRIETRRASSKGVEEEIRAGQKPSRLGPWVVEINGLNSILTLRRGPQSQPVGTTVTITLRAKPEMRTSEDDQVNLGPPAFH
jgi:hypothetical protein